MKKVKGLFAKILPAVLCVVLVLGCFAGCAPKEKLIQIWVGSYWGGDNEAVLQSMVDKWNEYAAANGKTKAELSVKQDMKGNMTTGAISGMIGDIVMWDRWESLRLANQEVFLPLDDKLAAAGHSADEFHAAAMSETKYNGKHYGIPFDLDCWGLFVNRNLYLTWAKSVTDPDTLAWLVNEGKTDETTVGTADSKFNYPDDWDEFYTAAHGCTKRGSNGSLETAGLSVDVEFVSWMATAGGVIADAEAGKVMLQLTDNMPSGNQTYRQATEKVLNFWDKMLEQNTDSAEEKQQAITSFTFFSNTGTLDYFLTQKVAFKANSILNGMTTYNKYKDEGFDFDYIPFPSAPGMDKKGGMLGGYSMAIPKRAAHTAEAWELIEWWVLSDDNYMEWSKISNLIPTRTALIDRMRDDEAEMAEAAYLIDPIDHIDNYAVRPPHIAYSLYETNVQTPALDVYLRRTTQGASSGDKTAFHMNEFFRKINDSSDLSTLLGV